MTTLTIAPPVPPPGLTVDQYVTRTRGGRRDWFPHDLEAAFDWYLSVRLHESEQLYAISVVSMTPKVLRRSVYSTQFKTWGDWV